MPHLMTPKAQKVGLFSVDADHPAGDADHGGIFGNLPQDNGICRHTGIISNFDGSQDLGAGAHHHIVAQGRVALALHDASAAQGHALIDQTVVADLGGGADDDAGAMVDDQSSADGCGGMDLHARQPLGKLAQKPRQKPTSMEPQPVADPVNDNGVQAVVQKQDFPLRPRRRVVFLISLKGFFQMHRIPPFRRYKI